MEVGQGLNHGRHYQAKHSRSFLKETRSHREILSYTDRDQIFTPEMSLQQMCDSEVRP